MTEWQKDREGRKKLDEESKCKKKRRWKYSSWNSDISVALIITLHWPSNGRKKKKIRYRTSDSKLKWVCRRKKKKSFPQLHQQNVRKEVLPSSVMIYRHNFFLLKGYRSKGVMGVGGSIHETSITLNSSLYVCLLYINVMFYTSRQHLWQEIIKYRH